MGQLKNDLVFLEINILSWPPLSWRSRKIRDPCRSLWGLHPALGPHHTLIHLPQPLPTCQSWERPLGDCRDSLVLACRTPRPKPSWCLSIWSFCLVFSKGCEPGRQHDPQKEQGLRDSRAFLTWDFQKVKPQFAHLSNGNNNIHLRGFYGDDIINGGCYSTGHGF